MAYTPSTPTSSRIEKFKLLLHKQEVVNEQKLSLNKTQLEILKLFSQPLSEEDLKEIKLVLVNHLSEKLTGKIAHITEQKGYTQKDFDNWLNDPQQ